MSVGGQASAATVDNALTGTAVQLRNLMQTIKNLNTFVNGEDEGAAFLESLGYDSADAATAQTLISYLNTIAGVYYGTVQQGGSGGTGAILFDFDTALAPVWAGQ